MTFTLIHGGQRPIPGLVTPRSRPVRSHVEVRPAARRIDPLEVRPLFVTQFEAELIRSVLAASPAQACRDLAADLAAQWSRPMHPSMCDDCDPTPPRGTPRGA